MRVKLAKTAGFCMGVRRAMKIVLDAARRTDDTIYTLGSLIHNPQVLELLERKNIAKCNVRDAPSDATVVIRAHGIPPAERALLEKRGVVILDATCPHVLKVQQIVKKHAADGWDCVIVGDKGHAEVVALLGFAGERGRAVETLDEIENLPQMEKVCVVAQTTLSREFYDAASRRLKERFPKCKVFDTICRSTVERQREALKIAKEVEAMVVVGGRNSANTRRLAEICRGAGKPTFHIERAEELDEETMKKFDSVGVTAGASTPNWLIQEVVAKLESLRRGRLRDAIGWALAFAVKSNLYLSVGAGLLCYACCVMLGIEPRWVYLFTAAFYVFAMHTANKLTDEYADLVIDVYLPEFYSKFRTPLALAAAGCIALILGIAVGMHMGLFVLLLLACAAGAVYRLTIVPPSLSYILRYRKLIEIPGSKEIFLAGGWAMVCVLVPVILAGRVLATDVLVAFLFAFSLVFMRAVLLDIRDVQRDEIVGRETIPVLLGKNMTKYLLGALGLGTLALTLLATYCGLISPVGYLMALCVAYAGLYLLLYHLRLIAYGIACEIVVDAGFILTGLLALTYRFFAVGSRG